MQTGTEAYLTQMQVTVSRQNMVTPTEWQQHAFSASVPVLEHIISP